jgi:hypothetical protein
VKLQWGFYCPLMRDKKDQPARWSAFLLSTIDIF